MQEQHPLTALEALGIAIRTELDAWQLYDNLAGLCDAPRLQERLFNFSKTAHQQQKLLEKTYQEMFPEADLQLPTSQLPVDIADRDKCQQQTLANALRMALEVEKRSREFYLKQAEEAGDPSGQRMFSTLAKIKFSRLMMLSEELETLEKYPAYHEGHPSWDAESTLKKTNIKPRN